MVRSVLHSPCIAGVVVYGLGYISFGFGFRFGGSTGDVRQVVQQASRDLYRYGVVCNGADVAREREGLLGENKVCGGTHIPSQCLGVRR